jgi:AcrR family transcriptional regulator
MARRRRTPLTRERVLRAAVALADERGVEAISMRRLGQELGVEAMALYNHVANKDEILSGILDLVVAEIELPSTEHGWKQAMRRSAISAKDALLRHPWAGALWISRQSGGPAGLRRTDWSLRTFREAGLSKDLTYHAFHIVEAFIVGATVLLRHVESAERYEGGFELGIDLILDGLESLRGNA